MHDAGPLDLLPIWGVFLATVAVIHLAVEGGFRLGQYRRRRSEKEDRPPVGEVETLTASENLPTGKVQVRDEFTADQPGKSATGGRGRLIVNGKQVGENHMDHSVPMRFSAYAGMDIGKDTGEPVSPTYEARSPFAFTGKIERVVFDLSER